MSTAPLTITLKTLTPLWTGGADGKSDRLHTTGLIGSLRWWYEALVRAMGGRVCDPIIQACIYDPENPNNGLCLGCELFGATGWARRFRLSVEDATYPEGTQGPKQPSGNRFKRNSTNQRPSWYFPAQGRGGSFMLSIIRTAEDFDPLIIVGLLKLIEQHAALAAKTQLGYGCVQFEEMPSFDPRAFAQIIHSKASAQPSTTQRLPDLREIFFAQVQTRDSGLTATLNLRYDVRSAFRAGFSGDRQLRHWVCGSVQGNERQASKLHFSQAINGQMRVWGWIPGAVPKGGVTRDQVVDQIKATVSSYGTLQSWREFDSPRDSVSPLQKDVVAFLVDLLK